MAFVNLYEFVCVLLSLLMYDLIVLILDHCLSDNSSQSKYDLLPFLRAGQVHIGSLGFFLKMVGNHVFYYCFPLNGL